MAGFEFHRRRRWAAPFYATRAESRLSTKHEPRIAPRWPRDHLCRSAVIRSRRIWLMRVRWPSPCDRSQSRTSASMRTVVCFLRGLKNSSRRMAVAQRSGGSERAVPFARGSRRAYRCRVSSLILIPFLELIGVRSLLIFVCLPGGDDTSSRERSANTVSSSGPDSPRPIAWYRISPSTSQSSTIIRNGSEKARFASSKLTECFARLLRAFAASRVNSISNKA